MTRTLSLAVGAIALTLSGCASVRSPHPVVCGLIGAAGGGGAGGAIGGNSENEEGRRRSQGIAIGAFAGAVVGYALCAMLDKPEPPPPAPPRAAPSPPPPPPPPPKKPEPEPKEVRERIVLRGVQFDFDSADIRPDAAVVLDEAVRLLNQAPETQVRIEGHTDWTGPEAYNQRLSERRAEAVKRYLVEHGVDADRLETAGYGESRPIASNETREGRALNRRVELQVEGP